MIGLLALLLAGGQSAVVTDTSSKDIVVTGQTLAQTERVWVECRKRHCAADEEIKAALAHGENLFVAGDYVKAQGVLYTTINNTRGAADRYPVEVGDLRRAEARIKANMGEIASVRTAATASLDALKAGLPKDDPRVLGQAMEIGDAMLHEGKYLQAVRQYADVAERTRKLNVPAIEGYSLLRIAAFWTQQAQVDPGIYTGDAKRALDRVNRLTGPAYEGFRQVARLLDARLRAKKDGGEAMGRIVAAMPAQDTSRPTLLYQPQIRYATGRTISSVPFSRVESSDNQFFFQWVDIGYRIMPDGSVVDAAVLRDSGQRNEGWVNPVLTSINGRRYAPITRLDGVYRVERYSRAVLADKTTGSAFPDADGEQRLLVTDLTR